MQVIRPVTSHDLVALVDLAAMLGAGMTTFPADPATLDAKIASSVASFAGAAHGAEAQFLMALEDTENSRILGVSAVYPVIGHPFGFFSYHVDRLIKYSNGIGAGLDCQVLSLSNAYTGLTEIGTLAVSPEVRGSGAGRLLAKARYLLMATFPELFADRVIAELRGWQGPAGESPFWSAVGEKFFRMPFADADVLSATAGAEFIANLMPTHPIYLDLLPVEARVCVGRPHQTSAIAMGMLLEEGFRFENYVDVFDAGPQLIAPLQRIETVRNSFPVTLKAGMPTGAKACKHLVALADLAGFRLVCVAAERDGESLIVDPATIDALGCGDGSSVRAVPL